ncbi:MAG: Rubrerythrin, partial [Planctomycetes bacterium GWC2_49_10]
FISPFVGMVPGRKLTDTELVRALRLNLAAELEATHLYQSHADATDNEFIKKILLDIADEERVHAGEFLQAIKHLVPDEQAKLDEGAAEVEEMAQGLDVKSASKPGGPIPTIGDLKA